MSIDQPVAASPQPPPIDDEQPQVRPFFWLHIKKVAGKSIRKTLGDHYVQLDRHKRRPLADIAPQERNDWINNYRQDLGDLQFHRARFARQFVYSPEEFEAMFKFAFVRNPYARAVSMWRYCWRRRWSLGRNKDTTEQFKRFLRAVPSYWKRRVRMHHATHTRPMLPDMTDADDSTLLLDFVGRVENLDADFKTACSRIGLVYPVTESKSRTAPRTGRSYHDYYDAEARRMVEELYGQDIAYFDYRFDG
jgi:hypothetical protein